MRRIDPLVVLAAIGLLAVSPGMDRAACAMSGTEKGVLGSGYPAPGRHCLSCHEGRMAIRAHDSDMMQQIYAISRKVGDPNGCVLCHGGNPAEEKNKTIAHTGAPEGNRLTRFSRVPGALQVNEATCGQCHAHQTYSTRRSIMNSDAGKNKAILWSWGIGTEDHAHPYGNHRMDDPDGATPAYGSDSYKAYMRAMAERFPEQFPDRLDPLPEVDIARLAESPEEMAAYSQLRGCNACHLSNKGHADRGRFRGMGCAACHVPYGADAHYEGNDKAIDKSIPGQLLVHAIQGTRKSEVAVNGKRYTGIQVATCASCHTGGRRIGFAYQGLMPFGRSAGKGPFDGKGRPQQKNGANAYKYMRNDVHHLARRNGEITGGLLCQDCHTTGSMHGNGNIGTTTLATIEIECADCHGTPQAYPWQLPLGFGDEFGKDTSKAKGRGLTRELDRNVAEFGNVHPPKEGYLLSSRGNALGNVVKDGGTVRVHSASGTDFEVPLLRELLATNGFRNPDRAVLAMDGVARHMKSLECYACHSTWAPQYYGYHHVRDFRGSTTDWIKSADTVAPDGTTADFHSERKAQGVPSASDYVFIHQEGRDRPVTLDDGTVTVAGTTSGSDYSFTRSDNPPLGINGEGRVSPLTGVVQTIGNVLDTDGNALVLNAVAQLEGGVDAMTLAPLMPHTTSRQARDCFDCHGSLLAAGYGVDGGVYDAEPETARFAGIVTADGEPISRKATLQIQAIPDLGTDFTQAVDLDGNPVMTVDSHWASSSALTDLQRAKLDRRRTCAACHGQMPEMENASISMLFLARIADILGLDYADGKHHAGLIAENNLIVSWLKAAGILGMLLLVPVLGVIFWRRRQG